jgi:type II secretory pathway component PulF
MINFNKIGREESTIILKSLKALMRLGNSLFESLQLQIEIEEGKNKKVLEKIVTQIRKNNKPTEDMLFQYGLINDSEKLILENSKDTKKSVSYIIGIREISSNFNKTMQVLLFFPIISIFLGLSIAKFLLPIISAPVNELIQVAQIKKGISLEETMNIPPAFFYIHHPESVDYVIAFTIVVIACLFFLFRYLEKNNPSLLYKIAPLKAFDDIPYIFTLMRSLNVGGMDIYSITNVLSKSKINKGWRYLFLRLKKRIEQNKKIYTVFQEFGFPKQLSVIIKTSESSKSFWDNFDDMIEYAKEVNINKNKEIRTKYSGLAKMVGYSIIVYFLAGILLLMFSMQNIITAMQ